MKIIVKRYLLLALILLSVLPVVSAQDSAAIKEAAYIKTINERSDKIVAKLGITDKTRYEGVKQLVAMQYRNLNDVYTARDAEKKLLKQEWASDKKALDSAIKKLDAQVEEKTNKLHQTYLTALSEKIDSSKIEQIKDGMTYGVLPITYKGYQDMIPTLTAPQKVQILAWLTEAREHAMDAESSEKKHGWFGKYKGRINNYLSAQGYDAQKERAEWEKRIKAAADAKKNE